VSLALGRRVRRVPRHQDLVIADADSDLAIVEIGRPALALLHELILSPTPQNVFSTMKHYGHLPQSLRRCRRLCASPARYRPGRTAVPPEADGPDVSATRTPARRLVAVLLLSLVAVLALVAGAATAEATPEGGSVGNDVALAVAAPQSTLLGRLTPTGLPSDGTTPAGHPGPVLDTLLLAPPEAPVTGPAGTVVDLSATTGLDPGHGSLADPRGPPTA